MQIFQGVYNGKKANALARGLKVLRDVGRREGRPTQGYARGLPAAVRPGVTLRESTM